MTLYMIESYCKYDYVYKVFDNLTRTLTEDIPSAFSKTARYRYEAKRYR